MAYKNPCATADVIVEKDNQILLIKRKYEPFKDMWALPGGHINFGEETLEKTAIRELQEETGILVNEDNLKLLGVYSEPQRDPRGHYITHVYLAIDFKGQPIADDDAKDVRFFPLKNHPELAFDHERILNDYQDKKTQNQKWEI